MSRQHVRGAQPPPVPATPTYPILRPQKDGPLDVTLLADTGDGILVHWVQDKAKGIYETLVCWQYERDCPYHHCPLEWTWFMPCYDHRRRLKSGLRCSPREYDAIVQCLGIDLRWAGRRITIKPTNNGRGKLIEVTRASEHVVPADLPPFDLSRSICHVLRCDHIPAQSAVIDHTDEIPDDPSASDENGGVS